MNNPDTPGTHEHRTKTKQKTHTTEHRKLKYEQNEPDQKSNFLFPLRHPACYSYKQIIDTDMVYYIYLLLKYTVPK
jgi:hypothetical protein